MTIGRRTVKVAVKGLGVTLFIVMFVAFVLFVGWVAKLLSGAGPSWVFVGLIVAVSIGYNVGSWTQRQEMKLEKAAQPPG